MSKQQQQPYTISNWKPTPSNTGRIYLLHNQKMVGKFVGPESKTTQLAKKICRFLNPIKVSSRKGKARDLQKWLAEQISLLTGFECGQDKPIESRGMGQSGVDVRLDDRVAKLHPFAWEAKAQESWSVGAFIKQAKANTTKQLPYWAVCMKKSREDPVVVIDAKLFFKLLGRR